MGLVLGPCPCSECGLSLVYWVDPPGKPRWREAFRSHDGRRRYRNHTCYGSRPVFGVPESRACPCGGDFRSEFHEQSLLHRNYQMGRGRGIQA